MGADLLIVHWWTTRPRDGIDWGKGHEAIEAITLDDIDVDEWADEFDDGEAEDGTGIEHVRERMHAELTWAEAQWVMPTDRDIDVCELGPVTALMTAGMSWGDDPTEAFSKMSRVPPEALLAAGFFS